MAIASWRPGAVDIFFRGADDTLMHWPAVTGSDGIGFPTHDPESHRGLLTSGPAAVGPHIGRRIDVSGGGCLRTPGRRWPSSKQRAA